MGSVRVGRENDVGQGLGHHPESLFGLPESLLVLLRTADVAHESEVFRPRRRCRPEQADGGLDRGSSGLRRSGEPISPRQVPCSCRAAATASSWAGSESWRKTVSTAPAEYGGSGDAVEPLGGGVEEGDVALEVDRDHGVIHPRQHLAAKAVGGGFGTLQRVDPAVDQQQRPLRPSGVARMVSSTSPSLASQRRVFRPGARCGPGGSRSSSGQGNDLQARQNTVSLGHVADELGFGNGNGCLRSGWGRR